MPTTTLTAQALLRQVGLLADGPVRWDQSALSRAPGVFLVETPDPAATAPIEIAAVRAWLERVPSLRMDGARPDAGALADRLRSYWLPGQHVLYVGRTSKSLGGRILALYRTPLGDRQPHAGGHWLRTLTGYTGFRVWWAETAAPEEAEDAIVSAIAATLTDQERAALPAGAVLPWANLEAAGGEKRAHGITGALLEVEIAPPPKSPVMRTATRASGPARAAVPSTRRPAAVTRGAAPAKAAGRTTASGPAQAASVHVTADGLEALRAELRDLTEVQRPQVIERVKLARELGDLRENADYEAARKEQSFLEGRVQAIEQMLRAAVVIDADHTGAVILGSTVVCDVDGNRVTLHIVGSTEADPAKGRISNVSPVGRALIGHREGETVEITTPARTIRYRILEVSRLGS